MTAQKLTHPLEVRVNRSDLRAKQRETLERAKDNTVVVIMAPSDEDEKAVLDKKYYQELVKRLGMLAETLEIMMDRKLFDRILRTAATLEEKTRLGKLHSFEETFGEK